MKKLIFGAFLLLGSCAGPTSHYSAAVSRMAVVGTNNPDSVNYFFSGISDFKVDSVGDLFVLDQITFTIKEFSPNGELITVFGKGGGGGPGEFRSPNAIAVDGGKVFVLDQMLRRLTAFNADGTLFGIMSGLEMMPSQIVANMKLGLVFIVGYAISYDGPLVRVYRIDSSNHTFIYDTSIVERYPEVTITRRTGNTDRIVMGQDNSIFYSELYPYKIIRFTSNGKLIDEFEGPIKFSNPPVVEGPIVRSVSGSRGLTLLNDSIVVNVVNDGNGDQFLDLFLVGGKWLCSISSKEFGLSSFRHICGTRNGEIYLDIVDPVPLIIKYHVDLVPKNSGRIS